MIIQAFYRLLITLALLASLVCVTLAQDRTLWITEVDGSPSGRNITKIVVTNGTLSISGQTATITTGGGGGGGTPGGSINQAQFNAGAGAFGGSSALTLTTTTANITTGSVLNALTMTLGSDATGDIYYRAAGGALTRLPIGTAAQVLTVSGGLPAWATASAGGSPGGSGSELQFRAGASTFGAVTSSSVSGGQIGINITSALGAQVHVVSGDSARPGLRVDSAPSPSGAILEITNNATNVFTVSNANAALVGSLQVAQSTSNGLAHVTFTKLANVSSSVLDNVQIYSRSDFTPGAGFGGRIVLGLESDTTNDQDAASIVWSWSDPANATRTADLIFSTVASATGPTERLRLNGSGLTIPEISGAVTPAANKLSLYVKDKAGTSALYMKNDAGTETEITGGGGGSPAGSTGDYQINNAGAFGAGVLVQGSNGRLVATPTAISSGVTSYFAITTPADTGITADTESIGIRFGGNTSAATVTRTLADGTTLALQRENVFVHPTYAAAGATTLTTTCTLCITGAPASGANITQTNQYALFIGTDTAKIGWPDTGFGQTQIFGDGGSFKIAVTGQTAVFRMLPFGTGVFFQNTSNGGITFSGLAGANSTFADFITNEAYLRGVVSVGFSTAASAQLHAVSQSTSRVAERIESASGATVALTNLIHTSDQTAAVRTHSQFYTRSSGTAATGLGGRLLLGLESSTTNDQDAASIDWLWADGTHATRTGDIVFNTVNSAAALAEAFRITGNALPVWPNTVTAGGTTGNQTINKPSGTVNIAAAGTAVTVTNSVITANSIVFAIARTNDGTCAVKNAVPGSGTVTINMTAACTAETSVGFFVINK